MLSIQFGMKSRSVFPARTPIYLFFLLILSLALPASILAANESEITFRAGDRSITLSEFQMQLFRLTIEDIEAQRVVSRTRGVLSGTMPQQNVSYQGEVKLGNRNFEYIASNGVIEYFGQRGQKVESLPVRDIFTIVSEAGQEAVEKCPVCVGVIVGIIVNGIMCSGGEGASAAYCHAACQCGVQSYSSICVAGSRQVTCVCSDCPELPDPSNMFPISGSWSGPLVPGLPWIDYGGMLVIPDPY